MSDTTQAMVEIWQKHLGDQPVGPDDDFYALGGDSLIALRVVADANARGIPIELRDLLFFPTVSELVAAVAGRDGPPGPDGRDERDDGVRDYQPFSLLDPYDQALMPAGVRDAWPASALQVGLIYLSEASGDPRLYQDLVGVEVTGPFDEALFTAALAELCDRHQALRSSFDLGSYSVPAQLLWSTVDPPLTVEYATTAEPVARWRETQLSHAIDWGRPPVLRCHVVALKDSFHITLAIHHAILDGWSYARLCYELLALYDAKLTGRPADLPLPPASGQRDFLRLEREAIDNPEAADYWHAEADVPGLLLDRGRFGGAADPREMLTFDVGETLLEGLRTAAGTIGVPLKSLVLGCHVRALSTWTGRDRDVVTGLTVNGRPETAGADLLVGLFLNTVPIRIPVVPDDQVELCRSTLAAEQRGMRHRRYPLARIEQRLGRPPFDSAFNFTHFHVYDRLGQLTAIRPGAWWAFDKTSFPFMVDFMINSRDFGTAVAVAYDPDLFDKTQAMTYLELYRSALHAVAGMPD
ncbi:condensation domain-containing protein [Micromonospora sp. CPCC 206060]|uniref:condensation domain-containing protein n=1 Tax=Micromonospora sp. CPCC 206060 TaxID=3122406 RepID=UPI002FEF9174